MNNKIEIKKNTIIQAGTGAGKSFTTIKHINDNEYKRFLVLTSSKSNVANYRNEVLKYRGLDEQTLFLTADTPYTVEILSDGSKIKVYEGLPLDAYRVVITSHAYLGFKGHTINQFNSIQDFIDSADHIIVDESHLLFNNFHKTLQIRSYYALNSHGEYKIAESISKEQQLKKGSDLQFIDAVLGTTDNAQEFVLKRVDNVPSSESTLNFMQYFTDDKTGRVEGLEEIKELRQKNDFYNEKVYTIPNSKVDEILSDNMGNLHAMEFLMSLTGFDDKQVKLVVKESKKITNTIDGEEVKSDTKYKIKNADSAWLYWNDVVTLPKDKTTFLTATLDEDLIPDYYKDMEIFRVKPRLDHVDINEINLYVDSKNKSYSIYNDISKVEKVPTMIVTSTKQQMQTQLKSFDTVNIKRWNDDTWVTKHKNYQNVNEDIGLTYGLHAVATGSNQTRYRDIIVECNLYKPLISRIRGNIVISVEDDVTSTVVQNLGRILRTEPKDLFNGVRNIYLSQASETLVEHVAKQLKNGFSSIANINVPIGSDTINEVLYEGILLPLSYCNNKTVSGLYKYLNGAKDKEQIKQELDVFVNNGSLKVDKKGRYTIVGSKNVK